jgi:hypothetical protein
MKSAESEGLLLQPALKRHYMWSTAEVKIVKELYGTQGPQACLALLPGRTLGGVYQQAAKLGLPAPVSTKERQHWTTSDQIDTLIRGGYLTAIGRNSIAKIALRVNRPKWWVSKRARALGILTPRFRDLPWSKPELALLEEVATLHPDVIARRMKAVGFQRTGTACLVKLKRMKFDRVDHDQWSANALGALMGVHGKTITGWIEREGLPATRAGTARVPVQGGDEWRITRKALREWIRTHAQLVDLRKVDRFWFIELVLGPAL